MRLLNEVHKLNIEWVLKCVFQYMIYGVRHCMFLRLHLNDYGL